VQIFRVSLLATGRQETGTSCLFTFYEYVKRTLKTNKQHDDDDDDDEPGWFIHDQNDNNLGDSSDVIVAGHKGRASVGHKSRAAQFGQRNARIVLQERLDGFRKCEVQGYRDMALPANEPHSSEYVSMEISDFWPPKKLSSQELCKATQKKQDCLLRTNKKGETLPGFHR
jgi:hypothetical protein